MEGKRWAVFCDRDGTIIRDVGYPRNPEDVCLVPGAAEALAELHRDGFLLVLFSNQSGIGRGLVTEEEAARVHERFEAILARRGVRLDGAYYCPHAPEAGCACRKPSPGMIVAAAERFNLDLGRSWVVGDKDSDVEAGRRAGCRTIRLVAAPDAGGGAWAEVLRRIRDAHGVRSS
jgi:histidinol-phosphate phosphatase family protein